MVKSTTSTERTLKRLQSDWRKWLDDPKRDTRQRNVDLIEKSLRSGKGWRGAIAVRLLDLAHWHAKHGGLAVLDGTFDNHGYALARYVYSFPPLIRGLIALDFTQTPPIARRVLDSAAAS